MVMRVQQRYVLYLSLVWERAKRASETPAAAGDESVEQLLLRDWEREQHMFSGTAVYAKRRCLGK